MKLALVIVRLASALLLGALSASAQDAVSRVYDRVLATFHLQSNRRPPTLRVQPIPENNRLKGAYCDPEAREIVLDPRLANRFIEDAKLGEDALAFVLGHELGHFYGNHELLMGTAGATATKDGMATRRRLEESADTSGLLHAHLAGYRGATVAPAAIAALYELYNLPPEVEGYPSRDARVSSAGNIVQTLRPLLPLYPLAISLIAGQHLEEAALVLGYLADKFQSPDLVHNAAVLQAMLGLSKTASAAQHAEIYPFVLSTANLLASGLRGSRGGDSDPLPHLKSAVAALEKLAERNPRDPSLRVNLALVYDLLGRRKEGLDILAQPEGFTPETQPLRVAAQAILWHHTGQTVRAGQAIAKQNLANRAVWEAFFRNQARLKVRAGPKSDPPCPPLSGIAQRSGYGSSSLWSNMTVLKGFGKVPEDAYDLSIEVKETDTALAARVRSHQVGLRLVAAKDLTDSEQESLLSYAQQTPPTLGLSGSPTSYLHYRNPSCQFLLGIRERHVTEVVLLEDHW